MGNCCKAASSMEWDGEDWSFLMSENTNSSNQAHGHAEKKRMGALRPSSSDTNGKVTIKISKKELTQLLDKQQQLNKKQAGAASAEQVLLRLIKARDNDARHRLWTPVLETIPEVS